MSTWKIGSTRPDASSRTWAKVTEILVCAVSTGRSTAIGPGPLLATGYLDVVPAALLAGRFRDLDICVADDIVNGRLINGWCRMAGDRAAG